MGKIWPDPKTPSQLRKALYDAQANTDGVTTTIDALAAVAVTADSPFGVASQILVSDGTARKAITSGKTFDIDGTLAANSDAHIATQKAVKTYVDSAIAGVAISDGDYGDIIVSGGGSAWNFDSAVVTTFARTFLDDANAAAVRTTLGLGTISTQDASNVTITGGSITGITDLAVADGGTGASTASGARTNLGLAINTDVQAWDADLDALAGVSYSADTISYFTGTHTATATTLTSFGRSLIDDTTAANARTTLGLGTVSTLDSDTDGSLSANSDSKIATQKAVKTYVDNAVTGVLDFKGATDCSGNPNYPAALKGDSYVVSVAGKIGGASGKSVDVGDVYFATADNAGGTDASVGSSWDILEHNLVGALLSANNLSDVASTTTARSNLGLAIGSNVQAWDADLDALAGVTSAADALPYFTGSHTATVTTLTTFGRSLIDDAAAINARTTLGLVIGTDVQAQDAELAAIAGLTSAANKIPRFTGSGTADLLSFSTDVTLAGNSDTTLSSQKAIKAYVDGQKITAPITLYVATTGNDTTGDGTIGNPWLTIGKALTYLGGFTLTAAVTITLADGHYASQSLITVAHPQGFLITITGTSYPTTSLTSVQSSSGSAGALSYVLNVGSVANIIVGDYVLLGATSGGSNPMYLRGAHRVTNVDTPNTRITVLSTSLSSTLASGAVVDTVKIFKSVLTFTSGQNGLAVSAGCSLGGLSQLGLIGGGTTANVGLTVTTGNSSLTATALALSNWAVAASASVGTIDLGTSGVSLCSSFGAVAQVGGKMFAASGSVFCGCQFGIASIQGSALSANTTSAIGNSLVGYYSTNNASLIAFTSNAFGNALGGYYADVNGHISATSATAGGNGDGVSAHAVSYIDFVSGISSGNSVDFSPAVNTLGNENSYINT